MSRFRNNTKKNRTIQHQKIENDCINMYNYFSLNRYKTKYNKLEMEEQLQVVRDALAFIKEIKSLNN
jgi:hypothetical protein|tara:strand:- start:155 stop:355 length:201 start_codon:yes stop_codon:yes gene_type:complete